MILEDLIEEKDYAAESNRSHRTVQRERALGIGPAFIKIGRKVYYRREAIDAWLRSKEQAQPRSHQHA